MTGAATSQRTAAVPAMAPGAAKLSLPRPSYTLAQGGDVLGVVVNVIGRDAPLGEVTLNPRR